MCNKEELNRVSLQIVIHSSFSKTVYLLDHLYHLSDQAYHEALLCHVRLFHPFLPECPTVNKLMEVLVGIFAFVKSLLFRQVSQLPRHFLYHPSFHLCPVSEINSYATKKKTSV